MPYATGRPSSTNVSVLPSFDLAPEVKLYSPCLDQKLPKNGHLQHMLLNTFFFSNVEYSGREKEVAASHVFALGTL